MAHWLAITDTLLVPKKIDTSFMLNTLCTLEDNIAFHFISLSEINSFDDTKPGVAIRLKQNVSA